MTILPAALDFDLIEELSPICAQFITPFRFDLIIKIELDISADNSSRSGCQFFRAFGKKTIVKSCFPRVYLVDEDGINLLLR